MIQLCKGRKACERDTVGGCDFTENTGSTYRSQTTGTIVEADTREGRTNVTVKMPQRHAFNHGHMCLASNCTQEMEVKGQKYEMTYVYDVTKTRERNLINVDELFDYERNYKASVIRSRINGTEFIYLTEYDSYGRDMSRIFLYGGKAYLLNVIQAYSDCNGGQILRQSLAIRGQSRKVLTTFGYTPEGHLAWVNQTDSLSWNYTHDANGNVIRIDFGIGVTVNHFNANGERIDRIGEGHQVKYDENGWLIARHDLSFEYDGFGKLAKVKNRGQVVASFVYGARGEVIVQQRQNETLTYFYGYEKSKPHLVSSVHSSSRGFVKLYYDDNDRIFAVNYLQNNQLYLVVSDFQGTPTHILDLADDSEDTGRVVSRLTRSPFGALLHQENPDFWLPLGFMGCIEEPTSGVLFYHGGSDSGPRPYDSHIGQFLVPDLGGVFKLLQDTVSDVRDVVHSYRFHNNDPINFRSKRTYMNKIEDWLTVFNVRLPRDYLEDGGGSDANVLLDPAMEQTIAFDNRRDQRRAPLFRRISSDQPLFGPNIAILIGETDGQFSTLLARAGRGAGTVEQVLARAVNGSKILGPADRDDLEVNLVTSEVAESDSVEILGKSLLEFSREKIEENRTDKELVKLSFRLNRAKVTIWIGFSDPLNVLHLMGNSTR